MASVMKELEGSSYLFGANAPFTLWANGKLVLTDPAACPPIVLDKYKASLRLRGGENSLLLVFAPLSAGQHFGIFVCVGNRRGKKDSRISHACSPA